MNTETAYLDLLKQTQAARESLLCHPIYEDICGLIELRYFMGVHVFAVWDFMTLLKTLQQRLTCVTTPWIPTGDCEAARLVNEIVLAEESDDLGDGLYLSHFELYIRAMKDVGADQTLVEAFVEQIRQGKPCAQAVKIEGIPLEVREFVAKTLEFSQMKNHEVAAAFLLGRENVIPLIFERLLDANGSFLQISCPAFVKYLERHIELDGDHHSKSGEKLLKKLCGESKIKWHEAGRVAVESLKSRRHLWDAVHQHLRLRNSMFPQLNQIL